MKPLIYTGIFITLLLTLLANPFPVAIEPSDLLLIAIPSLLALLGFCTSNKIIIPHAGLNVWLAVFLYLSYLLISTLLGLLYGIPLLNVLRSIGPYVNFFPLLFLSFLPASLRKPSILASLLVIVGLFQAAYQLYLYFTHVHHAANTLSVLRQRITLLEPRTTLPIVLASATLPLSLLFQPKLKLKILATSAVLVSLIAGAATLTRSIVLSIVVGDLAFILLYFYYLYQTNKAAIPRFFIKCLCGLGIFIFVLLCIALLPKVNLLLQGLWARFASSASSKASDYSNGRLYEEWVPALTAWLNAPSISLFFGIGAGHSFFIANGEERTYIHNLSIYSLVYGGFYGIFAYLWLYFTLVKTLLRRAIQTTQVLYLSFSALLISMFFYGQLFAVHKGLAYNAMLFLLISIALGIQKDAADVRNQRNLYPSLKRTTA
jgi:hypothetical protein